MSLLAWKRSAEWFWRNPHGSVVYSQDTGHCSSSRTERAFNWVPFLKALPEEVMII